MSRDPRFNIKKINDERDTMFSRMSLEKDDKEYQWYYEKNPDKQKLDDAIREKPQLCSEGTATYDPVLSKIADSNFIFLSHIRHLSEGVPAPNKTPLKPQDASELLKYLALNNGALNVGIVKLTEEMYYSHRGRHKENYGEEVNNRHRYAIVFAVEMKKDLMNRAPQVAVVSETSKAYVDAAIIGMQLSYYLRTLGYDSRNHMDGNYLLSCISVAYEAGLGQVGRNGLLTTKEVGSRLRLGVVSTNMELIPDEPVDFGLSDLCQACGKCVRTCPGKAISDSAYIMDWKINQEACYNRWRSLGTDCGICISVCPLSQDPYYGEKMSADEIQHILTSYTEKYGIRPYTKGSWPLNHKICTDE